MAGVQPGDVILQLDGEELEALSELIRIISLSDGSEMEWMIERGGRQELLRVTPRIDPPEGQGRTGIRIKLVNPRLERQWYTLWVDGKKTFLCKIPRRFEARRSPISHHQIGRDPGAEC